MFKDEFLENLPSDPYEAAIALCDEFYNSISGMPKQVRFSNSDRFIDAAAAAEAFIRANGLPFPPPDFHKKPNPGQNVDSVVNFFRRLRDFASEKVHGLSLDRTRDKYAKMFGSTFVYQFSDGDISRIQELLNELRDRITESELFDAKHKQRILEKFEKLQKELHKKMSNLDKLWGLIGEAGVVLGKFGKDAKPLADRIREIAQITWRTQARAEELPSGATLPLLSEGKQEDE